MLDHPIIESLENTGLPYNSEGEVTCPRCGAELYEGERLYWDTLDDPHNAQAVCAECLKEHYESLDAETFARCVEAEYVEI